MNAQQPQVGLIGLGAMGVPMARNLAGAGMLARIWNRTEDKAAALASELPVARASDPADLARHCEMVLTCVSADTDLIAVVDLLIAGLDGDKILIDTSTVQPATAREVAARLAEVGCGFLDAPVSGGVEGARQSRLAIMVGGEAATLARARPVLEVLGQRVVHMGPVGSGQSTKAINQIMAAGI
ncbi:MAG: NAD(P)-dependent oxidoreductase, partial [Thiohalobacteraceae bacterium]